jgi:phenylacetate-CoA ligase
MFEPEVETRTVEDQFRLDDISFRRQIAYLFDHSPFYREKLARSGFPAAEAIGGLDRIAALPLTEKQEIRASCTADNPIGAHLAVSREKLVRIYSTSGTTGTPSYIPLTMQDLDNWVTTSARSYSASGIAAGEMVVSTYNAGPFVAGAALAAFDRLGMCHIPVGTGNTERLMTAIRLLKPTAAVMTPSYASHLIEWAAERGFDLENSSVRRVLVAGEPGGSEPPMRQRLEQGWGAKVTEVMGIGDIGVSLWGECEEQIGMHFGGRGFVHAELIDPETGEALAVQDGTRGELVLTHLRASGRTAAQVPHPRPCRGVDLALPLRAQSAAPALRRPHRRHADRARRQCLPFGHPCGRRRILARGQRRDPGPAGVCWREAGTAFAGRGRTCKARQAGCRSRCSDKRAYSRRAGFFGRR